MLENLNKNKLNFDAKISTYISLKIQELIPTRDFIRFFANSFFFINGSNIFSTSSKKEIAFHVKAKYETLLQSIIFQTWKQYADKFNIVFSYLNENDDIIEIQESTSSLIYFDEVKFNYSFENFIEDDSNIITYNIMKSISCAICDDLISPDNLIYIYGNSGNGKTHLMQATNNYYKNHNGKSIYVTGNHFLKEYINSIQEKKTNDFYQKILSNDIILIDSFEDLIGKKATMAFLETLIKEALSQKKYVVLSSKEKLEDLILRDEKVKQIKSLSLSFEVQTPTKNLKRKIAIEEIKNTNISLILIDEILQYLGNNCREVKNSLKKITLDHKNGLLSNITDFKDLLHKLGKIEKSPLDLKNLDPLFIVGKILAHYKISIEDARSSIKIQNVCKVRYILMYILNKYKAFSYSEVGRLLQKNHSTVISGIAKVEKEISSNKHYYNEILSLINILHQQ